MPNEKELEDIREGDEPLDDEPEGDEPDGYEPEGDNPEGDKGQKPAPDDKEKNRKGFEIRQQQKAKKESVITSLSKEIKELKETVSSLTENSKDSEFRKTHSEISDELFNIIKLASKGSGKSYDECLNDPIIKASLETSQSKSRIDKSTPPPSTKTSPGGKTDFSNMSSDEFREYQEEVLRRG